MRELTIDTAAAAGLDELGEPGAHPIIRWAAQGFAPGVRAFTLDGAVAVASPALSCRDRLAVHGPAEPAARLLRQVLREVGPDFRPIGEHALMTSLLAAVPELRAAAEFFWMDLAGPPTAPAPSVPNQHQRPATAPTPAARWLTPDELPDAAALLDLAFPDSYAHPGRPGARAWAGVRDHEGRLTALAADAWSAPDLGLLAGVTAHPVHGRGRGHAEAACRLVLDTLVRRYGRAGLMVAGENAAAIRLYERLGLRRRAVLAAYVI
ncbi:GNAT family N-acetyltransferase [Kitasatospora sp. NBC_01287]|uniref:GNAT family N-acetyltransferase n=1 Tax=Kitasatospora sp. NBC_01287 TaxID=2903573 RepID=UPI00224D0434|nr:GNAT family N-acetyltransferase [Kitasatospora sp. NBC_01287]MCX4746458.1 GNAT family N-acetyltransferase [Kitasatospora sp. NBC_01287]